MHQKVLDDIKLERKAQIAQWGGAKYDDFNENYDWHIYLLSQLNYMEDELRAYVYNQKHTYSRLTKIAALAIAAMESIERKNKNNELQE